MRLRKFVMLTVFVWNCRTKGGGRDLRTVGKSFDHKVHSSSRWRAVCTVFAGQLQYVPSFRFPLTLRTQCHLLVHCKKLCASSTRRVARNSDFFREQYRVIGLCNGEALCFLCGGNWILVSMSHIDLYKLQSCRLWRYQARECEVQLQWQQILLFDYRMLVIGHIFVCCLLLAFGAPVQVNTKWRYRAAVFCDGR